MKYFFWSVEYVPALSSELLNIVVKYMTTGWMHFSEDNE